MPAGLKDVRNCSKNPTTARHHLFTANAVSDVASALTLRTAAASHKGGRIGKDDYTPNTTQFQGLIVIAILQESARLPHAIEWQNGHHANFDTVHIELNATDTRRQCINARDALIKYVHCFKLRLFVDKYIGCFSYGIETLQCDNTRGTAAKEQMRHIVRDNNRTGNERRIFLGRSHIFHAAILQFL